MLRLLGDAMRVDFPFLAYIRDYGTVNVVIWSSTSWGIVSSFFGLLYSLILARMLCARGQLSCCPHLKRLLVSKTPRGGRVNLLAVPEQVELILADLDGGAAELTNHVSNAIPCFR